MNEDAQAKKGKKILLIGLSILFAAALIMGILWLTVFRYIKYTTDAYVHGNKIVITPLIDGFITGVYSEDTYLVEKGQLILELDATNSKLAYQEAKEEYAKAVRSVCSLYHQTFARQADIQVKEAAWIKAEEFYNHRLNVLKQGAISLEDFQAAEATLEETYFALNSAQSLYQKEVSQIIGRSIRSNPIVQAAEKNLSQAWVNLYRCKIYAPVRGLVAQRSAQVGMWIESGTPLMSIIPLDQIWVNANYKETQMRHMKIGQKVKVKADMYGNTAIYRGTIVGLPGGAGNAFTILPPQNLSGNWIKIVQRLPVRVVLDPDDLLAHPLRLGMTMKARVDIRNQSGSYFQKASNEAPIYKTSIYENEIKKSKKRVEQLFLESADPSLEEYFDQAFYPEEKSSAAH